METKQQEVKQNEAPQKAPKKKGKNPFRTTRFKRGGMTTLMTVVFIAIVVVLNVVFSALTERFPSMDIDMTAQKLNTLSDQAIEIAQGIEEDTTIYLIGSEEAYENNTIYSNYGLEYSQVANLARRLAEANSHITVTFVDPDTNPQFISDYANDNLTTGKVMVETEKRHRVLTVNDLFSMEQDQTTGGYNTYSLVDSALAAALEVVNMDDVPVMAIATGHNEMLTTSNMAEFISLMEDQNFEVQEFDLLTEEVPEGTQILMLPTPTTDYSTEEIQKLRDYLNDTSTLEPVTLLATAWPTQGEMPNYAAFLEEWGVEVGQGVVAETDTGSMVTSDGTGILVEAADDVMEDNSYSRLVSYYSSPINLLFEANDSIVTYDLWSTSDTATIITQETTEEDMENLPTGSYVVASLSTRNTTLDDGSSASRSVIVFGSSSIFTDSFMSSAFGDRQYIQDLLLYITANDGSNVSVTTERVQTNVADIVATRRTIDVWGVVFTAVIPVVILAAGLVIFLKRRHL